MILLGARFSENPSQGFSLLDIPKPRQQLVHIHPGPEELGRIYAPDLALCATPGAFLAVAPCPAGPRPRAQAEAAHADYLAWSASAPAQGTGVDLGAVVAHLGAVLPADAILTNGAGN